MSQSTFENPQATEDPQNIGFGDIDYAKMQSYKAKGFEPACIFDIGGSDGSWTRKIMPLFPETKFHLFEPLADIATSYTTSLNQFVSDFEHRTTLHKVAVGKENGTLTFNHRKESPASSTAIEVGNKSLYEQIQLPMVTLDSLISLSLIHI